MNVVLCDDHRLFADALATVLEGRGCRVVAIALHPDAAVEAVKNHQVDVCVMDLNFPAADGLEGARRVIAASPSTKVVMLTGYYDRNSLSSAIDAGVSGFAVKEDDVERIIQVLEQAHTGEVVIKAAILPTLFEPAPTRSPSEHYLASFLTPREREVL
ncbi:MAG: response regulator, partial [Candidatus Methylomirabilales bacterium]